MEILEIEKYIFQSFKWRRIWIEKPYLNVFSAGNIFSLSGILKILMIKYFVLWNNFPGLQSSVFANSLKSFQKRKKMPDNNKKNLKIKKVKEIKESHN